MDIKPNVDWKKRYPHGGFGFSIRDKVVAHSISPLKKPATSPGP
jgi:hypothetical protein